MINSISLGGQDHRVLFGNWAFKKLKEETGLTLGDITEALVSQDVTIIPTVLFYAMQAACAYDKKNLNEYSVDDVALWMDVETGVSAKILPWLLESIADMTGQEKTPETPDNEAKKKK